ncbi:DUF4244 domain-containing protein [Nonomuraea sp. NN258]|uniref:DUF4244 domain-containing protein n=1 Tax=Nonomuraea antri TaxID=2730852 RepID=UPI00156A6FF9|nr:DUF4244 domain-containing protein [Nonomuraea antri]NRQ40213.1 DUF4244 domain-containing protein [Nonomuraea antri]
MRSSTQTTVHQTARELSPSNQQATADAAPPNEPPAETAAETAKSRFRLRAADKWIRCAAANRERGMSTAEYAVGTIAACAFAALLFKVVSSPEVQEMLTALIDRALKTNNE